MWALSGSFTWPITHPNSYNIFWACSMRVQKRSGIRKLTGLYGSAKHWELIVLHQISNVSRLFQQNGWLRNSVCTLLFTYNFPKDYSFIWWWSTLTTAPCNGLSYYMRRMFARRKLSTSSTPPLLVLSRLFFDLEFQLIYCQPPKRRSFVDHQPKEAPGSMRLCSLAIKTWCGS